MPLVGPDVEVGEKVNRQCFIVEKTYGQYWCLCKTSGTVGVRECDALAP